MTDVTNSTFIGHFTDDAIANGAECRYASAMKPCRDLTNGSDVRLPKIGLAKNPNVTKEHWQGGFKK